jgi:hypothetical protein
MASTATPAPKSSPSGSLADSGRTVAVRRFRRLAILAAAFAALFGFGLFDRSIRTDPFAVDPGWWQRFSKPQPDPRLAIIPVLPMGPAGVLSWRPKSTGWIAEKSLSGASSPAKGPLADAFGIGSATAGEPEKVRPKKLDVESPGPDNAPAKLSSPPASSAQQTRPPDSKASQQALPNPARITFVPDPASDTKFSQLPPGKPLPPDAYWAACDLTGAFCASGQGTGYFLSKDGGRNWTPDTRRRLENPPLLVLGDNRNFAFSGPERNSAYQPLIDGQLPFILAEYGIGNQTRGFQTSTLDEALDRRVREYLRITRTADRLHFLAVFPPADEASNASDISHTVFALFANGRALRATLKPLTDNPGQISQEPEFIDFRTQANLRSMHFQPGQRIGWISSGWNDGNEEGIYPAIFETTDGGKSWERLSYRTGSAPWVFWLATPGLMIALMAAGLAWRDIPKEEPRKGIADVGASDSPIGWSDRDVLGLKPLALSLSRFVRNTSTAPPLTIAITGEWGTGKSSLMNLVAEDLRSRGASPVWFNAWHHQKEENILAALLENIRAQAIPPIWRLSGLVFRLRLLISRIGANLFPLLLTIAIFITLCSIFDWRSLAIAATKWLHFEPKDIERWLNSVAGVGAGALLALLIKVYATMNLKPSELMATLRNNAKLADFSAQLSFRYKFAAEFGAAGKVLRTSTNPGLVIFIDDLDRCSPGNLMEVLESINFLTTAGPCFILLGMDEPKVIEIVAKQYDNKEDRARQYLKKLVNLTVPVPEVNEENSVHLSAGSYPGPAAGSPWPNRIRHALRNIPDASVPALALIALMWVAASTIPALFASQSANEATQQETLKAAPATDSADPAPASGPTRSQAVATPARIPTVTAEQLARPSPLHPYFGIGLGTIAIILIVLRRITAVHEDKVEDSESFRAALAIWHPAVFAADPTPRGVKRHQNRLRLQAMRLRPLHEKPDLIDSWFSKAAKPEESDPDRPDISEPKLVALGGVAALFENIPSWSTLDGGSIATTTDETEAKKIAIIDRCRKNFKAKFSTDWPPKQKDIDAFNSLRQSL